MMKSRYGIPASVAQFSQFSTLSIEERTRDALVLIGLHPGGVLWGRGNSGRQPISVTVESVCSLTSRSAIRRRIPLRLEVNLVNPATYGHSDDCGDQIGWSWVAIRNHVFGQQIRTLFRATERWSKILSGRFFSRFFDTF